MSPEETPVSEVATQKRKYVSRKGEFNDLSVEQVLEVRDVTNKEYGEVVSKLKEAPADATLLTQKSDLVNKRIRVYRRLRALGHSSLKVRQENAQKETVE